jgi:anti-sigma B factor antagonist
MGLDGDGMNIWQEKVSDTVRLVGVNGRLDQNLTPTLEAELLTLLDQGIYHIIVDLRDVNYINSGGLRCLVTVWRQAHKHGGDLVLCGLNDRVVKVFSMVGFDKVFKIYDDHKAARKAIQRS